MLDATMEMKNAEIKTFSMDGRSMVLNNGVKTNTDVDKASFTDKISHEEVMRETDPSEIASEELLHMANVDINQVSPLSFGFERQLISPSASEMDSGQNIPGKSFTASIKNIQIANGHLVDEDDPSVEERPEAISPARVIEAVRSSSPDRNVHEDLSIMAALRSSLEEQRRWNNEGFQSLYRDAAKQMISNESNATRLKPPVEALLAAGPLSPPPLKEGTLEPSDTLCLAYAPQGLTHAGLIEALESVIDVKVDTARYDPVYIRAPDTKVGRATGRWLFRLAEGSDPSLLLARGVVVMGQYVAVRRLEQQLAIDYDIYIGEVSAKLSRTRQHKAKPRSKVKTKWTEFQKLTKNATFNDTIKI